MSITPSLMKLKLKHIKKIIRKELYQLKKYIKNKFINT